MIKEGEKIPDVPLQVRREGRIDTVSSSEFCAGRRVVIFALPGAFTPTCSEKHLPGFLEHSEALRAKGVEAIGCLSVNDAFVMGAWGESLSAGGRVEMLADGSGKLTRALGLELDLKDAGFGIRSQRYAMVLSDGVVERLWVEPEHGFGVSSAESVLAEL
ncbi:MAG: peroxiredoxin [Alphaproteobacteria bacterium]|nr:peroxiredoxin [Alphaproteobacteria bacterium]MDA7983476.1 peroxiredoxin [Alphaproteobacteria bacterium]MDA7987728.1 peroxiredoxin [Alphaproteobacteria bacterium]MDA7989065.1 peroxiredoxin [Alphaproteobacteria bacterium]MDA8001826.1 peroxiredoxin [Alphaproteobacteria bacterium]